MWAFLTKNENFLTKIKQNVLEINETQLRVRNEWWVQNLQELAIFLSFSTKYHQIRGSIGQIAASAEKLAEFLQTAKFAKNKTELGLYLKRNYPSCTLAFILASWDPHVEPIREMLTITVLLVYFTEYVQTWFRWSLLQGRKLNLSKERTC